MTGPFLAPWARWALAPAVLFASTTLVGAPDGEAPGPRFLRGVALGLFSREDPGYIRASLDEIRALGAGSVSIVIPWSTPDVRSVELARAPWITPTDGSVVEAIRQARARGMTVLLFPLIHVERLEEGEWRGTLEPADWDAWFARYAGLILHYARMAQEEGAELLSVGSELCSTEHLEGRWRDLIARVRRVYGGRLVYSANWDHYGPVSFAGALDYLGVNAYNRLAEDPRPTMEELRDAWGPIRRDLVAWSRRHGRPLLFTEVGYPSREGAGTDPWDYVSARPVDAEVQRRCYRAFIEAWRGVPELAGVFFYLWWGEGGARDRDYTPRNKPAAGEMSRWFGREEISGPPDGRVAAGRKD